MVSFTAYLKTNILFSGRGSFWYRLWNMFLCWSCSESDPKTNMGTWCSEMMIILGNFKGLCIVITRKNLFTWCSGTVIVSSGILKQLGIVVTRQDQGNWCSDTVILYSCSFKQLSEESVWNITGVFLSK